MSRMAILLSALVYPGSGQYYQKRWIAGTVYVVFFTFFSAGLIYYVFKPMVHNLTTVLNWSATQMDGNLESFSFGKIFASFGLLMLVYTFNLIDVIRVERRKKAPCADRTAATPPPIIPSLDRKS
jgi:prepilin signal peptidase PulO-like enzyme (type II secretory pathway)